MSVGLALADLPLRDVAAIASTAEHHGLSHLLITELSLVQEPATGRDPFIAASAAMGATSVIRAGIGVAGSVFHSARHLALSAATVNEQSGGRFVLGIGVAHKAFADHIGWPYPPSPLAHMRRYAAELSRYSSGGVAFGGGFPIWLAALGQRMAELAAAHADGVILNWASPATVGNMITHLDDLKLPRPTIAVFLRVGGIAQLTAAAGRYHDMFVNYRRHFARQGLSGVDAIVGATCATVDNPASIAQRVHEYESAGADVVFLYPADAQPDDVHQLITTYAGVSRG